MWKKIVSHAMKITGHNPAFDRANMDAFRSSVLLRCHEWHMESSRVGTGVQPTEEDVSKFYSDTNSMDFHDMREYTQIQLDKQVVSMFTYMHEDINGSRKGDDSKDSNRDKMREMKKKKLEPTSRDEDAEQIKMVASDFNLASLMNAIGFKIEVKASTCPGDSGMGLFIVCKPGTLIPAGTLLALYPGLVHLPEFTTKTGYIRSELLPDPHLMLMLRMDNTVVDARTAEQCSHHPYALAHMVNHVPENSMPNVLQAPYNYPGDPLGRDEFPKHLQKFIPNSYAKTPTLFGTIDRSAMMRTVVLLAARPLSNGDELFMDYRLNPKAGKLPDWYVAYGSEEKEKAEAESRSGENEQQ